MHQLSWELYLNRSICLSVYSIIVAHICALLLPSAPPHLSVFSFSPPTLGRAELRANWRRREDGEGRVALQFPSVRFINPISTELCPTCVSEGSADFSDAPPQSCSPSEMTDNCRWARFSCSHSFDLPILRDYVTIYFKFTLRRVKVQSLDLYIWC